MRPTMTREIARASATDEANRNMKKDNRTKWNREDLDIAAQVFDKLWPIEADLK